ncbi:hypothetical protein C8R48DRAFT_725218 [Suillus tomentosus]|nr:hypothetical protein C8R48DRAFT_725218 [Suillus tomentosus]
MSLNYWINQRVLLIYTLVSSEPLGAHDVCPATSFLSITYRKNSMRLCSASDPTTAGASTLFSSDSLSPANHDR